MKEIWIKARVASLKADSAGFARPEIEIAYESEVSGPVIHIPVDTGANACIISKNIRIEGGKIVCPAFVRVWLDEENGIVWFNEMKIGKFRDGLIYMGSDLVSPLEMGECQEQADMENPAIDVFMSKGDLVKISGPMDIDIRSASMQLLPFRKLREAVRQAALEACSEAIVEFEESVMERAKARIS